MRSRNRQPYGLVPSIFTFALLLVIVVLLFAYTDVFNSWLAWVLVPAVVALVAYDVWLRAKRLGREDRWRV
jgi:4-hydroxybenzoate polyprenyltransferase